ncbi:MAG TPA: Hsp20/alpha crystallin family protein [Syntrophorhabdaceae bacterium]|nr:Hsp20/alpha crystallin family protein [Syntrophorhabdaceae bacterium]
MAARAITQSGKAGKTVPARLEDWNPFLALRNEMDKLLDNFLGVEESEPIARFSGIFQPKIDVVDADKEIRVSAEIPGIEEKDIDLSLTKDSLTIRGEKKEEKEEKGKDYHRMERAYGSFSRTIPLPIEVNTDKVEATYNKGVLTIVLPKTDKAVKETKRIPIKAL